MAVEVRIRFQFREVMELNRWDWSQRIKGYVGIGGGLFLMLLSVGVWSFRDNAPNLMPGVLAGVMFVLFGVFATRIAGAGTWLFKRPWRPFLVEVSQAGVAVTTEGKARVSVGWEVFKPHYETPNLLVLPLRSGADAVAIPKRCCDEKQLAELRELLTRQSAATPAPN
jgi:hypothetical protein